VIGPRLRSWALAALALSAADDGDADLAERYGREAVDIAVAGGSMTALECHFAYVAFGEALRLQGALDRAEEQLAAAARLTARVPGTLFQAFTLTFEAQRDLTAGERPRARTRAAAARAIAGGYPDTGVLATRLTEIETALQRGAGATRGSAPTPGELRVLTLLASGMTREEIAGRLFVSKETVRSHVRRLYQRLGVHSREDAVTVARARGLI
jgi:LuxR family transcriptional regulator, maltose regulon positive regulatory protein